MSGCYFIWMHEDKVVSLKSKWTSVWAAVSLFTFPKSCAWIFVDYIQVIPPLKDNESVNMNEKLGYSKSACMYSIKFKVLLMTRWSL